MSWYRKLKTVIVYADSDTLATFRWKEEVYSAELLLACGNV